MWACTNQCPVRKTEVTQNRGTLTQRIGCKCVGKSGGKERRWQWYLATNICGKQGPVLLSRADKHGAAEAAGAPLL